MSSVARPVRLLLVLVASLGAGVLSSGGFEPVALGWLVPLGTTCWLVTTSGAGRRVAFASGVAFGLGFFLPLLAWLGPSIGEGAWVGLGVVQALWFGLAGLAVRAVRALPGAPVAVAAVLTAVELARQGWPFGGLPWGRAGFSVVDTAWSGMLPWLGVSGTTFVLMLWSASAAAAVRRPGGRTLTVLAVVSTVSSVPLVAPVTTPADGRLTIAAVQGGVPGDGTSVASYARVITRDHRDATVRLARRAAAGDVPDPDLVVWPESSTAVDPVRDPRARRAVDEASRAVGVPLLVNGIVGADDPMESLNQAVLWNEGTGAGARYTKRHPVPFGEYVPFRDLLGDVSDRFREIPRDVQPGGRTPPMEILIDDRVVQVALAICFDVAYDDVIVPQVAAGADVVVVQTSNATFTGTDQLDQQLALTRARAIESGRAVVVSSINGLSAVIGPGGEVVASSPVRVTDVLVDQVPTASRLTPATRLAPVTGPVTWTLAVSSLALAWLRRRRADPPVGGGSRCRP